MESPGNDSQFASYDKRLISILEILGAQSVDIYYNHVYISARTHLKPGDSLTDEYVKRVRAYIIGVKTDEGCYLEVIQNLHKYFQSLTRYTTLSFADFVEKIVQQFVPPEYYDLLKAPEKDEYLSSIVADLVSTLGAYVAKPDMLRRIIDEHDARPTVTIRMAQSQAVTILLAKRGEIHNSFLRRIGQAKDTVPVGVIDDLKQAIRKLVKQKAALKSQLGETEERALELEDRVSGLRRREAKFKKLIRLLQGEREQGLRGAAFSAAVPRQDFLAEEDPLELGRPDTVPRRERIAEMSAALAGPRRPAVPSEWPSRRLGPRAADPSEPSPDFFAPPEELPFASAGSSDALPPEAPPRLARSETIGSADRYRSAAAPPSRRAANIADLIEGGSGSSSADEG
jgi:hypothetical protein